MKTILIIIVLHSTAAVTTIEFDNAKACEQAAEALRQLGRFKTVCTPKG
jgi:DNA-binding LacI/PurR family transcriptional regulator